VAAGSGLSSCPRPLGEEKRDPRPDDFTLDGADSDDEDHADFGTAVIPIVDQPDGDQDGEAAGDDDGDGQAQAAGANNAAELNPSKSESWAQFNARQQKGTIGFINSRPAANVTVMRRIVRPIMGLMSRILDIGGVGWARRAAVAAGSGTQQRYRITSVAGEISPCMQELRELLRHEPWDGLLREEWRTVKLRNFAFRLTSRSAGALQVLLEGPHEAYPYKLFRRMLLSDNVDRAAKEVIEDPPCMKDWFTIAFLRHYPNPGHPDAMIMLAAVARAAKVGIAHIEARHATLRRIKCSSSTTWSITVQMLSAFFSLLRCRIDSHGPFEAFQETPSESRPERERGPGVYVARMQEEERARGGRRTRRSHRRLRLSSCSSFVVSVADLWFLSPRCGLESRIEFEWFYRVFTCSSSTAGSGADILILWSFRGHMERRPWTHEGQQNTTKETVEPWH